MNLRKHRRPKPGAFNCICGSDLERNEKYDAYYCIASKEWVENQCSDLNCCYCSNRPDKQKDNERAHKRLD